MMHGKLITLVILIVTTLKSVRGLPTCEAPPIFIKPFIFPSSYAHSTLSPELLKILGHSRSNTISQDSPPQLSLTPSNSLSATNNPPSFIPSGAVSSANDFNRFPTLYNGSWEFSTPRTIASRPNPTKPDSDSFVGMPSFIPTTRDSIPSPAHPSVTDQPSTDLDRPTNCYNDRNAVAVASSVSSPEHFPNPIPPPEAACQLPPTTVFSAQSTASTNNNPVQDPYPASVAPSPLAYPFPAGPTLLPIKPLNLSPEHNRELQKFLSDFSSTSSRAPPQVSADRNSRNTLDPLPGNLPLISSTPSDHNPSSVLSQPPAPVLIRPPNSVTNHMLNSPYTINQLNPLLECFAPNSNFNPLSIVDSQLSSFSKSCLNKSFINYLFTLPRFHRLIN